VIIAGILPVNKRILHGQNTEKAIITGITGVNNRTVLEICERETCQEHVL